MPVIFESGSRHQALYAMAVTFLTFGAYAMVMPYSKKEDNFYALAAQGVIFFNLMSALAQPLGAGMDAALSTLVIGFTVLAAGLSMHEMPKKIKAKLAAKKTSTAPRTVKENESWTDDEKKPSELKA